MGYHMLPAVNDTRGPSVTGRERGIVFFTLVGAAVLLIVAGAMGLMLGVYNVAADAPHSGLAQLAFAYGRERSINVRAANISVPPLSKPEMISEGAEHYAGMCTGCHLAPGMPENEMRPGMNPRPPALATRPAESPAEQFWIVKHGIKMTGMPAWGMTHSDAEIWNIVAFLQQLPKLSPSAYRAMVRRAEAHHEHDDMPMAH